MRFRIRELLYFVALIASFFAGYVTRGRELVRLRRAVESAHLEAKLATARLELQRSTEARKRQEQVLGTYKGDGSE